MAVRRARRALIVTVATVAGIVLAFAHVGFGFVNFQPGFPVLEGVAAITAGLSILVSLTLARRSMYQALMTARLATLPLVAWFAYAVPVEGSSDPVFFWASLVVPIGTAAS